MSGSRGAQSGPLGTPPRGPAPPAAAPPRPLVFGSSVCNQARNVPSARLTPRNCSFSDIYALNRRPNTADSCLLSLHGTVSSFQGLHSVSGSASLSLVSSKSPVTPEEKPRITPASQQRVRRERGAQTSDSQGTVRISPTNPRKSVGLSARREEHFAACRAFSALLRGRYQAEVTAVRLQTGTLRHRAVGTTSRKLSSL